MLYRSHTHALQLICHAKCVEDYLEIGIGNAAANFDVMPAPRKTWVDPSPWVMPACEAAGFRLTSDEYFASTPPTPQFDLIFIDGLHHAEQVLRDLSNALQRVRPQGTIVIHDCWPDDEAWASRHDPGGAWTGDVWKAAFQMAADRPALNFRTWIGDFGVCVLTRFHSAELRRPLSPYQERPEYSWDHFLTHRDRLLRSADWDQLWTWFFAADLALDATRN